MAELALPFAKVQEMEVLSARAPSWAKADRIAALNAYDTTPVESSPLFVRHIIVDGAPVTKVALSEAAAKAGVTFTSVAWALDHAPKLAQELLELPATKQQDKFFHLAR